MAAPDSSQHARESTAVTVLIGQLRSPEKRIRDAAAAKIWHKYADKLMRLAKRQLAPKIRRRFDEEDVLQNVYNSFCKRQQLGQYDLANRDDLWKLLFRMTIFKSLKAARYNLQGRRNVRREQLPRSEVDGTDADMWMFEFMDQNPPTPAEAAILADGTEHLLGLLDSRTRPFADLRLQGLSHEEIASATHLDCAVETVARKLKLVRKKWEAEMEAYVAL